MKSKMLVFLLLSVVMCLLAGCNRPVFMSMGTAPLPVYHEPRWSGEQDKKWVVSADAFVGPYGVGENVREVLSLGGDLSVMYRFMNPLFFQASFPSVHETSGHFQKVISASIDCDRDTLLYKIDQTGAACHTGNRSCFYTSLEDWDPESDKEEK